MYAGRPVPFTYKPFVDVNEKQPSYIQEKLVQSYGDNYNEETSFIFKKPALLPNYSIEVIKERFNKTNQDDRNKFDLNFSEFKKRTYGVRTSSEIISSFFERVTNKDGKSILTIKNLSGDDRHVFLSEARRRSYFDIKYNKDELILYPTAPSDTSRLKYLSLSKNATKIKANIKSLLDKSSILTRSIINNIFDKEKYASFKEDSIKIKKHNKLNLNVLDYETLVLYGNIATRLNKIDYKVLASKIRIEPSFEGEFDKKALYGDNAIIEFKGDTNDELKTKLDELSNFINANAIKSVKNIGWESLSKKEKTIINTAEDIEEFKTNKMKILEKTSVARKFPTLVPIKKRFT